MHMDLTICRKFLETVEKYNSKIAISHCRNKTWLDLTWFDYRDRVANFAAGLHTLGVQTADRVAILANTRPEWAISDMAILSQSAITVPLYPTSTIEDVQFILNNSKAELLIVDNIRTIEKLRKLDPADFSFVKNVICIELNPDQLDRLPNRHFGLYSFDEISQNGAKFLRHHPSFFSDKCCEVKLQDHASIIYTSGTTGTPKGVVLTHAQIMSEVGDAFPLLGVTNRDRTLTFLPFAHVLGRIELWGHVFIGYHMAYAEGVERVRENLQIIKPTILVSVPRIFEKIYNTILVQAEISPVQNKIFTWAIDIGRQVSHYKIRKEPLPLELIVKFQLADRLVLKNIREKFGGELRFSISGGAPLNATLGEFFHAIGILILEGYGLTETTAAILVNTPFDYRFGCVGKPIGDVQVKLAEDGEILIKSKKVMKEYFEDPEATAQVLHDGWFSTGDIGVISPEGYLKITDRKKDLIKTAGGKYVAPQKLEALLKTSKYVSQVHIHGDRRKYIVVLVTLNSLAIEEFLKERKIAITAPEAIAKHPLVRDLLRRVIAEANKGLASFESIKNFAILPRDFSIEDGELTPSLKVKRKVVDQRYATIIEKLYGFDKQDS